MDDDRGRSQPPPRRRLRIPVRKSLAVLAGISLILAVAGWHYWMLYSSAMSARAELLAAAAVADRASLDVQQADIDAAASYLQAASGEIRTARAHYRWDPLIRIAAVLPVIGKQVSAGGEMLEIARLLAEIGIEATTTSSEALALRDSTERRPIAHVIDTLLDDSGPSLERIDRLTAELVEHRTAIGDRDLVGPLDSARRRLDAELPTLVDAVDAAVATHAALPGLLGFEGERRYLVLALNNGELMPGGGLITATGIVAVRDGEPGDLEFTDSTLWKQQWEAQGGAYIPPPGPLQRYLLRDYTWNLLVANWSPDFPTWSSQALEFYEAVHGPQQVDGVIALDLVVLQRLLAITGPKSLEITGRGLVTFDSTNAVLQLEALTRQSFDPSEGRKSVIGDLAELLVADIQELPSDKWPDLLKTIRGLGAERHIQASSSRAQDAALIERAGWSGRVEASKGDYLQLNEASLNSTKLNLIIVPDAVYRIDFIPGVAAHHTLELRYENTLPKWQVGKDPRLVKQLMLGGLYGGYLRVFGPDGMSTVRATINSAPASIEDTGREAGKAWSGVFMPLPSGARATVRFEWSVPASALGFADYELLIQKQPGTTGMCIDLGVTTAGETPATLAVRGGKRDAQGRICLTTDVKVTATAS